MVSLLGSDLKLFEGRGEGMQDGEDRGGDRGGRGSKKKKKNQ